MKLSQARCAHSEFANASWTITVEAGTTLEQVMSPEFLANVASQMRPYDKIMVRVDDGVWYAELLVLTAGRTWVKTKKLIDVHLTSQDVDMTESDRADGFEIKHRGPHNKFSIIRKIDNEVIREQFETKDEARTWLADYVKS